MLGLKFIHENKKDPALQVSCTEMTIIHFKQHFVISWHIYQNQYIKFDIGVKF